MGKTEVSRCLRRGRKGAEEVHQTGQSSGIAGASEKPT